MSLDGHDKLCGYLKSMFPLCIYGGLDTYRGRMNFLPVWTSNNNPKVIATFVVTEGFFMLELSLIHI